MAERHLLTVAVEDYFQVAGLAHLVRTDRWSRFESRVEANTHRALDLLDEFDVKATFFVLGWVAESLPALVREISARGHEVASKGFLHRDVSTLSRDEFRADVVRARDALEHATGQRVFGHRVAQGSLGLRDLWALDVLAEEGFAYDSSIYPRGRSVAAEPWRRFPHVHENAGLRIHEFPLSSFGTRFLVVPIAGGNYMRQLPHSLMKRIFESWTRRYTVPFNMYFHVWELDPELPRITAARWFTQLRQYRNVTAMPTRLRHYLSTYRFQPIARALELVPQAAPERASRERERLDVPADASPSETVSVVVPCYNEAQSLPYLANTLRQLSAELAPRWRLRFVFVDDCSRDTTWEVLQRTFGDREDCDLVRHEVNRGVAAAILTGIHAAKTEIAISMDCDCTYDPLQMRELLPMLQPGVAMVTASPYHPQGRVVGVPGWRLFLSRGLSRLYGSLLEVRLATYTSCFRAYRRDALLDLELSNGGFLGVAEMLALLVLRGERVVECPAVLESRLFGESKMRTLATIRAHLGLLTRLWRAKLFGSAS